MPFFEGKKAYEDKLSLEDNPYLEWERNFEEWDEGYFSAAKEDKCM